jgi:MFS family permease
VLPRLSPSQSPSRTPAAVPTDTRVIYAAQALRALAFGIGSVQLGAVLEADGWSTARLTVLVSCAVAGIAGMSVLLGRFGDRLGRRRWYSLLFVALAAVGVALATTSSLLVLIPVVLTGALSTEVVESGPFTTLEQSMIATVGGGPDLVAGYGWYNAVATLSGSIGALVAGGPPLLRDVLPGADVDRRFFWSFVGIGALGVVLSRRLSASVELASTDRRGGYALDQSAPTVRRLGALFAVDSFAGGFVVQTFIVFWLRREFDASTTTLGLVFFAVGLLQTLSFLAAPILARRVGLLNTMVWTHIPSNICLLGVAVAPNLTVAIACLVARALLGQMDVPTRQAYVMALVTPAERTAAAGYTNTARYLARPWAPLLSAPLQAVGAGAPFAVAGILKTAYDVMLYRWFRNVRLPE